MDSGSTVLEVVTCLPMSFCATIVTNSVPVAAALIHHPEIEVQVLGGRLKKDAQAMVGVPVVEALRQVRSDDPDEHILRAGLRLMEQVVQQVEMSSKQA